MRIDEKYDADEDDDRLLWGQNDRDEDDDRLLWDKNDRDVMDLDAENTRLKLEKQSLDLMRMKAENKRLKEELMSTKTELAELKDLVLQNEKLEEELEWLRSKDLNVAALEAENDRLMKDFEEMVVNSEFSDTELSWLRCMAEFKRIQRRILEAFEVPTIVCVRNENIVKDLIDVTWDYVKDIGSHWNYMNDLYSACKMRRNEAAHSMHWHELDLAAFQRGLEDFEKEWDRETHDFNRWEFISMLPEVKSRYMGDKYVKLWAQNARNWQQRLRMKQ